MTDSEIGVEIANLTYGGAFIGKITDGVQTLIGKKAFVRFAAPGEVVKAIITQESERFVNATLSELVTSSESRIKPECPHFGICGGCDLQHLTLKAQRLAKLEMVRDTLARQAKIEPTLGVTLIGEDLPGDHYRERVSLHIDEQGEIGFYRSGSSEVVPFTHCLIASRAINQVLVKLKPLISKHAALFGGLVIESREEGIFIGLKTIERQDPRVNELKHSAEFVKIHALVADVAILWGNSPNVTQENNDEENTLPSGHFSQVNWAANQVLVSTVLSIIEEPEVTEFYAGSGNFSLPLARRGTKVEAVELDGALVAQAKTIIRKEKLDPKIRFHAMSCENFIKQHKPGPVVLLDPPRSGAKEVLKQLTPELTKKIVYVSCNLPSLGRDLQILKSKGYVVKSVQVLDMFPQTHHVETISVLQKQ